MREIFWENLHSWHKFYTTAGRDGRDKSQLCIYDLSKTHQKMWICISFLAGTRQPWGKEGWRLAPKQQSKSEEYSFLWIDIIKHFLSAM